MNSYIKLKKVVKDVNKWKTRRLEEVIEVNPETLSMNKYYGDIQYIDISSVNQGVLSGYKIYDINEAPSRARRIIKPNDIIYSTVRPNLKAYYYVKDNCPTNAIASTGFAVIRTIEKFDSRFIYYMITENSFVDYLTMVAKGTAYPAVDTKDFKKAKVKIPPLQTQQKIADILSTYDNLIENNNRRIKLLEKVAQNLYKEWFVRFRFPNYKQKKFENALPLGWRIMKLMDVVEVGRGSSPRPISDKKYFDNGDIPWIKIADATASEMYIAETKEYVNEYGASFSRKLSAGSLILAASGTLGFPMFLAMDGCIHDGWLYFTNLKEISIEYLYYILFMLRDTFNSVSYGAAIQNINTAIVRNIKVILPDNKLLDLFTDKTRLIHQQIKTIQAQNRNLIKQRDLLLPRLMSGKIKV